MRIVIIICFTICRFWTSSAVFDISTNLRYLDRRVCQMICDPKPEIKDEIILTVLNYNGHLYHLYREFVNLQFTAWDVAYNMYQVKGPLYLQAFVNVRDFKEKAMWSKQSFYNLIDYMLDANKLWQNMSDGIERSMRDVSESEIYHNT